MSEIEGYWAPRNCLTAALPEHSDAARILSEAADAILADKLERARDLVRRADMPSLFEHADQVMNGKDPRIQHRHPVAPPPEKVVKIASRMPSGEATKALFARDGWRCRFCDCRVSRRKRAPRCGQLCQGLFPGARPKASTAHSSR